MRACVCGFVLVCAGETLYRGSFFFFFEREPNTFHAAICRVRAVSETACVARYMGCEPKVGSRRKISRERRNKIYIDEYLWKDRNEGRSESKAIRKETVEIQDVTSLARNLLRRRIFATVRWV